MQGRSPTVNPQGRLVAPTRGDRRQRPVGNRPQGQQPARVHLQAEASPARAVTCAAHKSKASRRGGLPLARRLSAGKATAACVGAAMAATVQ
ncbi:hypothetical protein B296_00019425 [Ensete ventricosum]|uniref:Uncharacterized protein n=1 Tax=Ensete ventricosum TaxID=4639 RepID=A0A426XN21_ENSVE|nr:hypothetical protein B296_00019425 [Ensete ventricosum]